MTDVPSPGGWLQTYGVRVAKGLAVGTVSLAAVFNISGVINSNSVPGTSTGATIQVDNLTRIQTFKVTCTATGGLTTTSGCAARSPLTSTGILLGFSIESGNMAKQLTGDVSFKSSISASSGSVLTNGNNLAVGTGATKGSQLAVPVAWNPDELLTFTTLVTPTGTLNTTRYDYQMWITIADAYGS